MNNKNYFSSFINDVKTFLAKLFIKSYFTFTNHTTFKQCSDKLNFYANVQISLIILLVGLIFVAIIYNIIYLIFKKTKKYSDTLNKFLNVLFNSLMFFFAFLKFYFSLVLEKLYGPSLLEDKIKFYENNKNVVFDFFCVFSTSLGDAICLLCITTGIICLDLLGNKDFYKKINNTNIFYIFTLIVIIMTTSNNLLIMFISFELLFLPTIYFVFDLGYMKKTEKAGSSLFFWTLCGSFLVLTSLCYIYLQHNTLNYMSLGKSKFSDKEVIVLLVCLLLGFGVKIPIIPFHFWLLKVHVESPTGFSMYLSGFLVKSALYCLFMFLNLFKDDQFFFFITIIIFFSLLIACNGLATVIDIKKLIAWATVQEMTFMLFFVFFKQSYFNGSCVIFVLLHGLMSIYMFYIVDIIQKRYNTRSLQNINGASIFMPKLTKYIWFLILLFGGFPFSAKFVIEWNFINFFVQTSEAYLFIFCFFVNFLGAILFIKHLLVILYGVPKDGKNLEFLDVQRHETYLLNFLIIMISSLMFLIYLL